MIHFVVRTAAQDLATEVGVLCAVLRNPRTPPLVHAIAVARAEKLLADHGVVTAPCGHNGAVRVYKQEKRCQTNAA